MKRHLLRVPGHIRHHIRFYLSVLFGLAVWGIATAMGDTTLRTEMAAIAFYLSYLLLTASFMCTLTPEKMRKRSDYEDEDIGAVIAIALSAVALSLWTIFAQINGEEAHDTLHFVLTLISVPLGWLMLHTIMALHYSHVYYIRPETGPKKGKDFAGLNFPGTDNPEPLDFVYHSFVIGMTAQVADVDITAKSMRRLVLFHSVLSFFYNTVLLALVINVVAG